jgi:hypothetical protein
LVLKEGIFAYPLLRAGDIVHFTLAKPFYDRAIAALPKHPRRPKVFDWGGALLIADKVVIYDESDEVALPAAQRSVAWQIQGAHSLAGLCSNVSPLWDHYYIGMIGC